MRIKTLARRTAALLATVGLAVGLSGITAPANASEDTGWGRIAPTAHENATDTGWGRIAPTDNILD